ncbi:MAG: PQQ-binding-like beta-propeller repeat protein, partial [Candidatus Brocadiales bacterium]|nr:PQQ-binding-like beta-propeller repeat protein [Candidatus Brocadiales bacterium]
KWSYPTGDSISSSATIDADGTIYIGSWNGNLYAFNPDGTIKWSYNTFDPILSSPSIGLEGSIYIGCTDYKLYAFGKKQ